MSTTKRKRTLLCGSCSVEDGASRQGGGRRLFREGWSGGTCARSNGQTKTINLLSDRPRGFDERTTLNAARFDGAGELSFEAALRARCNRWQVDDQARENPGGKRKLGGVGPRQLGHALSADCYSGYWTVLYCIVRVRRDAWTAGERRPCAGQRDGNPFASARQGLRSGMLEISKERLGNVDPSLAVPPL